jgi:hypothetical protein
MVRTGKRTEVLADALVTSGLTRLPRSSAPARPCLRDLSEPLAVEVGGLYRALGGAEDHPRLRPGPWDLVFAGPLLIELDEELHFNRYRATTLAASWERTLPWTVRYLEHCSDHEDACLAAGAWGKRWTNDSAGRMFLGAPSGDLDGEGAPRWKQRALYDSIKDTMPRLHSAVALARLATHDRISGICLGAMLDGDAAIDVEAVRALVEARMVKAPRDE